MIYTSFIIQPFLMRCCMHTARVIQHRFNYVVLISPGEYVLCVPGGMWLGLNVISGDVQDSSRLHHTIHTVYTTFYLECCTGSRGGQHTQAQISTN